MRESVRRFFLGAVIPVGVAAGGVGPYLAYRSQLPDRVASHFSLSGVPDDSMTPDMFLVVMGGLMVLALGACVAIAVTRRRLQPMIAPTVSFMGAFLGTLFAGILVTTTVEHRGLEGWQDARVSPWMLALWIGAGVITGSIAARIAASLPSESGVAAGAAPAAMDLAPGERVFWSSTLSAGWPLACAAAVTALAAGLTPLVGWWPVVILLVVGVVVISFSRIRVTADQSGLQVRYGFFGWPRTAVPIGDIAQAQAMDIRPTDWGGWGYRGSLTLMKRAAVVLRAGPGIRLDLRDGKVFVVTVDDPEEPARLLNAEVSRLATTRTGR